MKNVIVNLAIQLLWVAVALFIGYWLASTIFDTMLWRCLFSGIFSVIAYFLMMWLTATFKALKDPDVKAASHLRMTIGRYRTYKRLYDEHQQAMKEYGIDSKEATEIFIEKINPQIPSPNEWRRFCEYQSKVMKEEMMKMLGW